MAVTKCLRELLVLILGVQHDPYTYWWNQELLCVFIAKYFYVIKCHKIMKIKLIEFLLLSNAPHNVQCLPILMFRRSKRSTIMNVLINVMNITSVSQVVLYWWIIPLFFHSHSTFLYKNHLAWHYFILYFSILWKRCTNQAQCQNLARHHNFLKFLESSNTVHWLLSKILQA